MKPTHWKFLILFLVVEFSIMTLWAWRPLVATGDEPAGLLAGAAAKVLKADDSLVIGGGIQPGRARGQEGELRASAVMIQAPDGSRAMLAACDVLMVERDMLDRAAKRIEIETGVPFDNILINATHTHHAPTTVTVHNYQREEAFTRQLEDRIVEAAKAAQARLKPVEFAYRLGEESSVGRNSRLLLGDQSIYWIGPRDDVVRPTGPFDPELPVLVFRRPGTQGMLEAVLFNHSTHTIGTIKPGTRSPSFYGLAAQELEGKRGGTFLFFEGASGSTHNLDVPAAEAAFRIGAAVSDALAAARTRPLKTIVARRREIDVTIRRFDEALEDAAVANYCRKRMPSREAADATIEVFRAMRKTLAPKQGSTRKTWVQAVVLGDVAVVGVPGEFFTLLGQEIKRRSPYRDTLVCELANDYIGYIPDQKGFERGGYQVWMGLHSFLERGTGEKIVQEAIQLLDTIQSEILKRDVSKK